MIIPRPVSPLIRTTIDLRIDRPDRNVSSRLFDGWGVDVPGNRIL
jgi:hypothetical protein